jgi:autotransporter family porin
LPVGAALPSGAQCAARVRPAAEIRPENTAANNNRGSRANANTRSDWSGFNRVDGDFAGTTDQLIQWAACKWGIDEDIVRAQMIKESYWYQSNVGDNGESFGIGQVRTTAHPSAFQYAVNARNSTAYNLDYTYASWRACFEGVYTWLNTVEHNGTYGPGDVWGCVGLWVSGRWYVNNDAYLNQPGDSVRWHYDNKTWLTSGFING